ncbi:RING finger protein 151-like [Haliotis rufescens]|uniref:RING finger protein 151-like n=1 Tax=Haliotis rufescens TaxID=6454 RepID=UPI00201FA891|nr:RING finger protein 151-like [Haliotis rufescens]
MSKRKQDKQKSDTNILTEEGPRYFLNPESVSHHLYCSICQEVFSEPQRAPCGHSFCKKCILPWLKHGRTCPEDRKPLQAHQLHHDFILENIIGDQMVACPHRGGGCEFVGQLQQLASHKKHCDFNPYNLPDFVLKNTPHCLTTPPCVELDEDVVPSPGKPSLMLRLFRSGESQKQLLKSMFDGKENKPS